MLKVNPTGKPRCPACGADGPATAVTHLGIYPVTCASCGALYCALARVSYRTEEIPAFPRDEHWSEGFEPADGPSPPVYAAQTRGLIVFEGQCEVPPATHTFFWLPKPDADGIKALYDKAETWDMPHPGVFLARFRGLFREAWSATCETGRSGDLVALRNEAGNLMAIVTAARPGHLCRASNYVNAKGEPVFVSDLRRVSGELGAKPGTEPVH